MCDHRSAHCKRARQAQLLLSRHGALGGEAVRLVTCSALTGFDGRVLNLGHAVDEPNVPREAG